MDTKTVNLRDVPEELVRKAKAYAALRGMSLKDFFIRAVQREIEMTAPPAMSFFVSADGNTKKRRKRKNH
jgi:hypothetical protein